MSLLAVAHYSTSCQQRNHRKTTRRPPYLLT